MRATSVVWGHRLVGSLVCSSNLKWIESVPIARAVCEWTVRPSHLNSIRMQDMFVACMNGELWFLTFSDFLSSHPFSLSYSLVLISHGELIVIHCCHRARRISFLNAEPRLFFLMFNGEHSFVIITKRTPFEWNELHIIFLSTCVSVTQTVLQLPVSCFSRNCFRCNEILPISFAQLECIENGIDSKCSLRTMSHY